jgi:hypothetical protein
MSVVEAMVKEVCVVSRSHRMRIESRSKQTTICFESPVEVVSAFTSFFTSSHDA